MRLDPVAVRQFLHLAARRLSGPHRDIGRHPESQSEEAALVSKLHDEWVQLVGDEVSETTIGIIRKFGIPRGDSYDHPLEAFDRAALCDPETASAAARIEMLLRIAGVHRSDIGLEKVVERVAGRAIDDRDDLMLRIYHQVALATEQIAIRAVDIDTLERDGHLPAYLAEYPTRPLGNWMHLDRALDTWVATYYVERDSGPRRRGESRDDERRFIGRNEIRQRMVDKIVEYWVTNESIPQDFRRLLPSGDPRLNPRTASQRAAQRRLAVATWAVQRSWERAYGAAGTIDPVEVLRNEPGQMSLVLRTCVDAARAELGSKLTQSPDL